MPITHDSYLIAPHKALHGVYDASAKKKSVAREHAFRLAQKTGKVIVIVRVIEIVTPQQAAEHGVHQTGLGRCEEEGCKKPAVVGYCDEHF
jgi:hypothetical protein